MENCLFGKTVIKKSQKASSSMEYPFMGNGSNLPFCCLISPPKAKFIKGLCKKVRVKPFGFKAFRKYGPSVLNDKHKVSMKKLQRLLRHQKQATAEIYLKNVDNDLVAAVSLLEKKDRQRDTQTKKGLKPMCVSP